MTIKDILTYTWEKPVFSAVRNMYVRTGSRTYERNYGSDSERRVLFPRYTLKEIEIPANSSDLSILLNSSLKALFIPNGELDFVKIDDIDKRLKNENMEKVGKYLRKSGKEYCKKLFHIKPDDFSLAYDALMIFYDMILGAKWKDITKPKAGFVNYFYEKNEYPFKEKSLPEFLMWTWSEGAASELHSDEDNYREMKALISHGDKKVTVLSKKEKEFDSNLIVF